MGQTPPIPLTPFQNCTDAARICLTAGAKVIACDGTSFVCAIDDLPGLPVPTPPVQPYPPATRPAPEPRPYPWGMLALGMGLGAFTIWAYYSDPSR